MNILIVNAFGTSTQGKNDFKLFVATIEAAVKKISYKSGIDSFMYTYRDIDNIDDFVYTLPCHNGISETKKNEIKKNLEKLDFIFIDGKEQYLPWKQGTKLQELISLCKKSDKNLFAGGVACENLIFYLGTNGTQRNIINSNGDYPSIEELDKITPEILDSLHKEDVFLDYVTGDFYEYDKSSNEWKPTINIGLHQLLYAEKFYERGKFVLKQYHKVKNDRLVSSFKKEIKVTVQKQYVEHWLVKNVPPEFVVNTSLTWYEHNFCVNRRSLQFKTLVDSNFGAMIIEYNNTIGTLFHVMKKNPETILLLENFIRQKFNEVQNKSYFMSSVRKVEEIVNPDADKLFRSVVRDKPVDTDGKEEVFYNPNSKYNTVNHSRPFSKITRVKDEGDHCGFSYNNREMLFVENNAVIKRPISAFTTAPPYVQIPTQTRTQSQWHGRREDEEGEEEDNKEDIYMSKPADNIDDDQLIDFYKQQSRYFCRQMEDNEMSEHQYSNKISKEKLSRPNTAKNFRTTKLNQSTCRNNTSHRGSNNRSSSYKYMTETKKDINYEEILKAKDNESVLTMIFPYIKEDLFHIKEYKPDNYRDPNKEVIKVNLQKKMKSNFMEKYQKYDKDLNTYAVKPSIRCSSAYISEEEKRRRELIESKKEWVGSEDFRRCFGVSTNSLKPIPNIMAGSTNTSNPMNQLFRTIDKTKWVTPRNFMV